MRKRIILSKTAKTESAPAQNNQNDQLDQTIQSSENDNDPISTDLTQNFERIKQTFSKCVDFTMDTYRYGTDLSYTILSAHFDSMTGDNELEFVKQTFQDLVTHWVGKTEGITPEDVIGFFGQSGVSTRKVHLVDQMDQAIDHILNGHFVIFFDGWDRAISYDATAIKTREVTEPAAESVVQGPREGTVENIETNVGLLRSRLKNPNFKMESIISNGKTKTVVIYGYLEGAVDSETLKEFKKRISKVKENEILETSYVEELIEDSTYSPFPQYRYTERPDVAVANLLEGKIIVMVQGTGTILICPGLFTEFFQSSEDYYQRTVFSSVIRQLRVIAFFIALTLPGIYISLSTFNPELVPTVLLLAVIDSREGIPFPTFVEAIIMQFFFELLREAGIRLPRPVGSAVSIVGALVIGEAAINAGIASPIMVVVVALTGIASFSIPRYSIAISLRILQFPLMFMAATLGIFGMMIGMMWIFLHLITLRTLGQPYFAPISPLRPKFFADVFLRAPVTLFKTPRHRHRSNKS